MAFFWRIFAGMMAAGEEAKMIYKSSKPEKLAAQYDCEGAFHFAQKARPAATMRPCPLVPVFVQFLNNIVKRDALFLQSVHQGGNLGIFLRAQGGLFGF